MASNRKTIRYAVAALLRAHAPNLQAVYAYKKADFGSESPVALVSSSGTRRERNTAQGSRATPHYIDVHVFAWYGDESSGAWTEESAEDALDDVEVFVTDLIDGHYTNGDLWRAIKYADRSRVETVQTEGGISYRHEIIPLEVHA